jgi:hypothetical protein
MNEIAKGILFGLFSVLIITCSFALLYASGGWLRVGIGIGIVILILICRERGRYLVTLCKSDECDKN